MQQSSPQAYYIAQLAIYKEQLAEASKQITLIARLRLLVMLIALGFIVAGINYNEAWQWWASLVSVILFLMLVRIHSRRHAQEKWWKIQVYNTEKELLALDGDHSIFKAGEAYINSKHPFSFDLDVFGKGSLYQMLNRTVTTNGNVLLADDLDAPNASKQVIEERQEIITDLTAHPAFLADFRAAGMSVEEEEKDYERVLQWLTAPDEFINNIFAKLALFTMPFVTSGFVIYSIITEAVHPLLMLSITLNWIVLGSFSKKIKMANLHIGKTARLVEKYQQLQQQTASREFNHPWLKEVVKKCAESLVQIIQFRKLANTFDSRNNSMVGPIMNSLFMFDIYCLVRLEWWRKKHHGLLVKTMEEMIVMDVYVSCATYAFNHPENSYPVIDAATSAIKAKDLRHPLLVKTAVGNDCTLGEQEQFYLLTGANMTGKSTFIRTIGTNVILGYLGVPVPAAALTLPLLKIYTSIRVTDSVQDDVSYFRAELNRIKDIMDTVQRDKSLYLVLLDEPLRGTNSGDKQQGTRSIIETLLTYKATGIVATHDIGLCSLAEEHPGKVNNYHFESTVGEVGLNFDFRLYPGGSTSNNATILMKQMGIIH